MREMIALDVQPLFENNKTGIGWTVKKIVDHLAKNQEFRYQLNYFGRYRILNEKQIIQEYVQKNCRFRHCVWMELPVYRRIWNWIPIPYWAMFGREAQITQFFNYVIPPGVVGKKVLYVYDMACKAYPETINKRTKADLGRNLERSCEKADIICTISEFSKSEIIKYLGVKPEKIRVIPCGVDDQLFHSRYQVDEIERIKQKYGVKGNYFLYLGTLEPRKNVLRIVEAYSILLKEQHNVPKLVLAGKKGWLYEDIFAMVKKEHIEDCVIFTGYVQDDEVPILMNGALAFLFPSLYEGFGLPVLEAMACGTPVITYSETSIPEVAGDAGLLINPLDVRELVSGMRQVLTQKELRQKMIKEGLEQSKKFTWQHSAECLIKVYKDLLEGV